MEQKKQKEQRTCFSCEEIIKRGEPFYTFKPKNQSFHQACFTCSKCQEPLKETPNEVANKLVCKKCFLVDFGPKCVKCKRGIAEKISVHALGGDWHSECFVCVDCNKKIIGPFFTKEEHGNEEKPQCKECSDKEMPFCNLCKKRIVSNELMNLDGKKFHLECFRCEQCGKNLQSGFNFSSNALLLCDSCMKRLHGTKCAGCGKIDAGKFLLALDCSWHPSCFVCCDCKCQVTGKFFNKNHKPQCPQCNQKDLPVCSGCKSQITKGKVFSAVGKDWHPECFKCGKCSRKINGHFTIEKGRAFHDECLKPLKKITTNQKSHS